MFIMLSLSKENKEGIMICLFFIYIFRENNGTTTHTKCVFFFYQEWFELHP